MYIMYYLKCIRWNHLNPYRKFGEVKLDQFTSKDILVWLFYF